MTGAGSAIEEVFSGAHLQSATKGTILMHAGDPDTEVALLVSGRVKVTQVGRSGDELLLAVLGPGRVFGDFEALDVVHGTRSASIVALDDVTLRVVSAETFVAFLESHSRATLELINEVVARLRRADRRRVDWISMTATGRLAAVLRELGDVAPHGGAIDGLTQRDFGSLIGASEDSAARALHELRKLGVIKIARRRITIVDAHRLDELST